MSGETTKQQRDERWRERREMIWHYTTRLINAEVKLGRNPPQTEEGVKRLVENAARYVDAIFKEASE
jgi:predicted ribosome quality control (RQC) complex YloA/Tae2 family protein